MDNKYKKTISTIAMVMMGFSVPTVASASDREDYKMLKSEMKTMRAEMAEMQKLLKQQNVALKRKTAPEITKKEVQNLQKEVKKIAKVAKSAEEWKNTNSSVHLAGYASAGYTDKEASDGRFDQIQFSPIFHYQYKDLILLESELEFKILEDGSSDIGMEYLTLDLTLNDYATLVAGKFMSPIGKFRQNLHPSWINKLPSKPSGFGHNGAAPSADIGVQLRGAIPVGNSDMRANYAVFAANGPEVNIVNGKIKLLETGGFARDRDGGKVYGGRIGFIPIPKLEVGFSGATGSVAATSEADRNYTALGTDITYQWNNFDLRGEYIQQRIGSLASSVVPKSLLWKAWYLQGAYKLPYNLEGVLRYGDFNSAANENDQTQLAVGINYLFAPQIIAKIAYEFNDGQTGSSADGNRLMGQIAYGF